MAADLYRIGPSPQNQDGAHPEADGAVPVEFLDYCEVRRQALIQELRALDAVLVKNGRLRTATLPKRIR